MEKKFWYTRDEIIALRKGKICQDCQKAKRIMFGRCERCLMKVPQHKKKYVLRVATHRIKMQIPSGLKKHDLDLLKARLKGIFGDIPKEPGWPLAEMVDKVEKAYYLYKKKEN